MGIKDRASKAAAGAVSIAVATSGLSSCNDNGAVDPAPPPLQCDDVGEGQTLQATAAVIDADTVSVTIEHAGYWAWSVDSVRMVSGGTMHDIALPDPNQGYGQLMLSIVFDEGATSAVFSVFAKNFDGQISCAIARQFTVTPGGVVSSIVSPRLDELPLPARQTVSIELLAHRGNTATLQAQTGYSGEKRFEWTVSHGRLSADEGGRVIWDLPKTKGIYQAEVMVDFGPDGFAFDALPVEVE